MLFGKRSFEFFIFSYLFFVFVFSDIVSAQNISVCSIEDGKPNGQDDYTVELILEGLYEPADTVTEGNRSDLQYEVANYDFEGDFSSGMLGGIYNINFPDGSSCMHVVGSGKSESASISIEDKSLDVEYEYNFPIGLTIVKDTGLLVYQMIDRISFTKITQYDLSSLEEGDYVGYVFLNCSGGGSDLCYPPRWFRKFEVNEDGDILDKGTSGEVVISTKSNAGLEACGSDPTLQCANCIARRDESGGRFGSLSEAFQAEDAESIVYTNNIYSAIGCLDVSRNGLIVRLFQIALGMIGIMIVFRIGQAAVIMQKGNPESFKEGQEIIWSSIVALILILFSAAAIRFLGIDILGLIPEGLF